MNHRFLLLFLGSALAIAGCAGSSKFSKASSESGPTVCYKLDFCEVNLLGMSVHTEEVRRLLGEYPNYTREDEVKNGFTCSGEPYRYRLVLQNGTPLPVYCDDASHEGVHIVVYGEQNVVVIPDPEYRAFVKGLESDKFELKRQWQHSTDDTQRKRKRF